MWTKPARAPAAQTAPSALLWRQYECRLASTQMRRLWRSWAVGRPWGRGLGPRPGPGRSEIGGSICGFRSLRSCLSKGSGGPCWGRSGRSASSGGIAGAWSCGRRGSTCARLAASTTWVPKSEARGRGQPTQPRSRPTTTSHRKLLRGKAKEPRSRSTR